MPAVRCNNLGDATTPEEERRRDQRPVRACAACGKPLGRWRHHRETTHDNCPAPPVVSHPKRSRERGYNSIKNPRGAYELRVQAWPWDAIADHFDYADANKARSAARTYAEKHGFEWPVVPRRPGTVQTGQCN